MARGEITGSENSNFWFRCPGCSDVHRIPFAGEGPTWRFDGDVDHPTIEPSIKVTRVGGTYVCHSFVRAGRIQFLSDCTHELAGQTVDLPDWTEKDRAYIATPPD